LPDDVINANVMNPMIERWPMEWSMTFPSSEFKLFKDLESRGATQAAGNYRRGCNQRPAPSPRESIGDAKRGNGQADKSSRPKQ